ncbi:MAG: hypothetical protein KBD06_01565 [Candidatus Pacebacteria bacterium]|nr:hypothetical protein [Candidatus Paceibacterota bacterium]
MILLSAHIVGAIVTIVVSVYALAIVVRGNQEQFPLVALFLGALAGFELTTGALLAALSPAVTVVSVCDNIALYLALVITVEASVFLRMHNRDRFPMQKTLASIGVGTTFLMIGVVLGL